MFNKSLVVSLLIIGLTLTQAVPLNNAWHERQKRESSSSSTSFVFGSLDNAHINDGQTQNGSSSSQIINGSITDKRNNTYTTIDKNEQTIVVLPHFWGSLDNLASNPKNSNANKLTSERRGMIQSKITELKQKCANIKGRLERLSGDYDSAAPLVDSADNDEDQRQNKIRAMLTRSRLLTFRLNSQQSHLDHFSMVTPWAASKEDNFDDDLNHITMMVEQLRLQSLTVTRSSRPANNMTSKDGN